MEEDIELNDLDRGLKEREEMRDRDEGETSFIDDHRRDESILIIDGSNPVFVRPEILPTPDKNIPNVKREVGVMRRHIIHDKKQFLKTGLGITVNKGDGPSSTILYDELRTVVGKDEKINGATYKGKKILILRNGKMEYSTDRTKTRYVDEFKELLRKAYIEHQKTPAALVESHINVDIPQHVMNDIVIIFYR